MVRWPVILRTAALGCNSFNVFAEPDTGVPSCNSAFCIADHEACHALGLPVMCLPSVICNSLIMQPTCLQFRLAGLRSAAWLGAVPGGPANWSILEIALSVCAEIVMACISELDARSNLGSRDIGLWRFMARRPTNMRALSVRASVDSSIPAAVSPILRLYSTGPRSMRRAAVRGSPTVVYSTEPGPFRLCTRDGITTAAPRHPAARRPVEGPRAQ